MNKKLEESLTFGELLRWIGVWVFMSMADHYRYQDVNDDHSSARMHPISMEETWMTTCWPNHVFCFLLTLTIVNIQNAGCCFAKLPKINTLQA